MKKIAFFTVIILFLVNLTFSQGYKIDVKIKGTENQRLILGHHKNASLIPDDTIYTDSKGYGVFKGDKAFTGGLYFIFLEKATYFDFVLGDDQIFSIENDTTDLFKNLTFKGSDENLVFKSYQDFLVEQNQKLTDYKAKRATLTNADEIAQIDAQIANLTTEYIAFYDNLQTTHPNLFFTKFIKATRGIEVPTTITDQTKQYYYYRFHFFDNFDLSDVRLLNTPIFEEKIDYYLDNVIINHPDTLIQECNILLENADADAELYKYMLIHLFNKYAKSQLMAAENVYVHLGYIYCKRAIWDTDSFKNQLKPKLDSKAKCLIGGTAKDINLQALPNDSLKIELIEAALVPYKDKGMVLENDKSRTLQQKAPEFSVIISEMMSEFPPNYVKVHDIQAKYTILWFMEPDCSHCKKETPLLYKSYVDSLMTLDVAVMCVYMSRDIDDWTNFCNSIKHWTDFVQTNKMYKWYNVWNPFGNYREDYDISSSPVLYLLDENKMIIGKRVGWEQASDMIKSLEGVE